MTRFSQPHRKPTLAAINLSRWAGYWMVIGPIVNRPVPAQWLAALLLIGVYFNAWAANTIPPETFALCAGQDNEFDQRRLEACTSIIEAASVTPQQRAAALGDRGIAHSNRDEKELAIKDYEQSLLLDSTSAASFRVAGNKFKAENKLDLAITEYTKAIKLDPRDARALTNRGASYNALGRHDEALKDFDKAIALRPTLSSAYVNRARSLSSTDRLDSAIADLTKAIQISPQNHFAFYNRSHGYLRRASINHQRDDLKPALADAEAALQIAPDDPYALMLQCRLAVGLALDIPDAIDKCERALRRDKNNSFVHTDLGFAYMRSGDLEASRNHFNSALALGRSGYAYAGRALVREKLGEEAGAKTDLEIAQRSSTSIEADLGTMYGPDLEAQLSGVK